MTEQLRWEVIIDDKGAPKLVAMGNDAEKMGQKSETAGRRLRRMGDDAEQAKKGLDKANSAVNAATVALGNLVSSGIENAIGAMSSQIAASWEYAASLNDMSDRLNITTDDLQYMSEWAEQSGTDTESLAKSLGKLTTKIADGDATLKRYNITSGDMNEAFLQVADAVEKAPTQLEKARIANAAFGKSWQEIMPILKEGRAGLQEISNSVKVIDQEDIDDIAKLDDALASMKSASRGLGAELLAAFGPALRTQLEETKATVQMLRDAMDAESDSDFMARIGAKKGALPFTYKLGGSPDQMSSADIQRVLDYGGGRNGFTTGRGIVEYEDPKAWANLETKYKRALLREREIKKKADEDAAKRREEDRRAQAQMEADDLARESSAKLAEANKKAQADAEEYRRNIVNVNLTPEMIDEIAPIPRDVWNSNREKAFQKVKDSEYTARPKEKYGPTLAAQMDQYGFRDGFSYTYATDEGMNSLDLGKANTTEIRQAVEAARAYQESLQGVAQGWDEVQQQIEEANAAWERVSTSIADTASGELAPALWDVFARGHDAMDEFGDAAGNILRNLAMEFTQLALKWAILSGISAGFGGAGPGSFLSFLGGGPRHATGTVSSPGGIGTLGEMGPERYRLPNGIEGIAMAGTYAIPRGTQVWPTQASSRQIHFAPVFNIQGGDPFANATAIDRRIRDTAAVLLDDQERTRYSVG
jgi:hypothetical protein